MTLFPWGIPNAPGCATTGGTVLGSGGPRYLNEFPREIATFQEAAKFKTYDLMFLTGDFLWAKFLGVATTKDH